MEKKMNRRSFLKLFGAGTAATATALTIGCKDKGNQPNQQEPPMGKMTYRTNPNTHDKVSILGYGMMRLPTKGQKNGQRQRGDGEVDQEMVNKQVDYAIAHGVNYFDTSPVYTEGQSEHHTGIALKRHPRKSFLIATKMSNMGNYSREDSIAMFNNSLKELQVDYIDYYLLHCIGTPDGDKSPMDVFNDRFINNGILHWLIDKRKEGTIRNLGFSFHGDQKVFDHALEMHDKGEVHWDFVQIELNYLDWDYAHLINEINVNARYLYGQLEKRGIPAVIMEPLLGGRLANIPKNAREKLQSINPEVSIASWAFRYAATHKDVLCMLSGMTYMENLKDNLRTVCPLKPLQPAEMTLLEKTIAKDIYDMKTIPCNDCKYCMPCPYGVDIPGIFVHYNNCILESNYPQSVKDPRYTEMRQAFLVGYDRSVPKLRQADHCIGCGQCQPKCPQGIPIPDELHRLADYIEELKQDLL